jgi:hypothetical protein
MACSCGREVPVYTDGRTRYATCDCGKRWVAGEDAGEDDCEEGSTP